MTDDDYLEVGDRVDLKWLGRDGTRKKTQYGLLVTQDRAPNVYICKRDEHSKPWAGPPDYSKMPLLGDALMDADCEDEWAIEHCRQQTHCRDCWVIELLSKGK